MTLLARILGKSRRASPWVFAIRRPQGMSIFTFAVLATFAYRTLNGKGFLGRALTSAAEPAPAPRRKTKRVAHAPA